MAFLICDAVYDYWFHRAVGIETERRLYLMDRGYLSPISTEPIVNYFGRVKRSDQDEMNG